jgi:hypothetical protein
MKVPTQSELDSWWHEAQCKGMKVENVKREVCWDCPVQAQCLWDAIKIDDRLSDHPMFIRGGVLANKREELWFWHKKNVRDTYLSCVVEAERYRFAYERKQTPLRNKQRA